MTILSPSIRSEGRDPLTRETLMAERYEVVVKDIQMSLGSMVVFMVKWAIAAIPAFLILVALWFLASTFFVGVLSQV